MKSCTGQRAQALRRALLVGLLALLPAFSACSPGLSFSMQATPAMGTPSATFVPGTLPPNIPAVATARVTPVSTLAPGEDRVVPLIVLQGQEGGVLALVPIFIQGQGPYAFALDTGASQSLIDTPLAKQLNLPVTGPGGQVTGVTGTEQAQLVEVGQWRMGDLPLPASAAIVVDLPEPNRGTGLAGLLGSDVLSQFGAVTIDYDHQQLIVHGRG